MPAASWFSGLRNPDLHGRCITAGRRHDADPGHRTPASAGRLAPRDAEALFAIMSDPRPCASGTGRRSASCRPCAKSSPARSPACRPGQACYWAACLKGTGAAIGTCDLSDIDRHHGRAEVGFAFHRSYWGNGYALEAMKAVIAHAFGAMAHRAAGRAAACRQSTPRAGCWSGWTFPMRAGLSAMSCATAPPRLPALRPVAGRLAQPAAAPARRQHLWRQMGFHLGAEICFSCGSLSLSR